MKFVAFVVSNPLSAGKQESVSINSRKRKIIMKWTQQKRCGILKSRTKIVLRSYTRAKNSLSKDSLDSPEEDLPRC